MEEEIINAESVNPYSITVDKAKYTLPLDEWGDVIPPEMLKDEYRVYFIDRSDKASKMMKELNSNAPVAIVTIDDEEYDISGLSSRGRKNILNSLRHSYVRLDDAHYMSFSTNANAALGTHETVTAHETIEALATLSEMGVCDVSLS